MSACIHLQQRYGRQWKVEYEESYYAERGDRARNEDPWLMVVRCQHGNLAPWGGDLLAACTARSGQIANRLKALPFVTTAQDGDDGANCVFDVARVEEIAAIMKPKRKRPPRTEAQRQATEQLSEFRFPAGKRDANSALESPRGPQPESEHTRQSKRTF